MYMVKHRTVTQSENRKSKESEKISDSDSNDDMNDRDGSARNLMEDLFNDNLRKHKEEKDSDVESRESVG